MLTSIIAMLSGLVWLLVETDYLRVQLPCGAHVNTPFAIERPYILDEDFVIPAREYSNPCANLLPERCEMTRLQDENKGTRYNDSWVYGTGYNTRRKSSYQQLTIDNQVITLLATSPKLYAMIDECRKAQDIKQRDGFAQAPIKQIPMFIEQVRTGSEKTQHGAGGRRYYEYDDTYKTEYRDCLVSKEWLKEHEHDLDDYEPAMTITAGDNAFNFTGDYKKGAVRDCMTPYTKRIKIGRSTRTISMPEAAMTASG